MLALVTFRQQRCSAGMSNVMAKFLPLPLPLPFPLLLPLFALPLLFKSTTAHAEEPALTLDWSAPRVCPSRDEVLAEATALLHGSLEAQTRTSAEVVVLPLASQQWTATLTVRSRGVRTIRTLEARDCRALASATALILAVSAEGDSPLVDEGPSISSVMPASRRRLIVTDTGIRHVKTGTGSLTGSGILDFGTLPQPPAPGVELSAGWAARRLTWRPRALAAVVLFPSRPAAEMPTGDGGSFSLISASGRICGAFARAKFEIGPCLGAAVDRMSAVGSGLPGEIEAQRATAVWLAASAGGIAVWRLLPKIGLVFRVDVLVPLARTQFVIAPDAAVVHRPSSLAVRSGLGLELQMF